MGLQARFVPLVGWPGKATPHYSRKRAPFRVGYPERLNLLENELAKLSAKEIVIQAQFQAKDIRNDGWPRSSARPSGPAIVVSFKGSKGPLCFPCDRYDSWEDNLYAIALSLEALRAVDRHGVTQNAEQYKGWAQLPPPAADKSAIFQDAQQAAQWLAVVSGGSSTAAFLLVNSTARDASYRMAAKRLHPDVGGSKEDFQKLQDAMRILRGEKVNG